MYEERTATGSYIVNNTLQYGHQIRDNQSTVTRPWVKAAVVLVIFCALGFPGTYIKVFGNGLEVITRYGVFFLQILLMLVLSANRIEEIKLINLKPRYAPIYLFLATLVVVSMIATSDVGEEVESCVRFSVNALFGVWIADRFDEEDLLSMVNQAMVLYVFAAVTFAVLFPGYYERMSDQQNAFLGLSDTKNVSAMILVFGIIMQMLLWKVRTEKNVSVSAFFVGFLAFQIFLMVLADSKGAMVYCALIVGLILFVGDRFRINVGMICVLASILFLVFAMTILPLFEPLLDAMGKDVTLTGRVPLWSHLLDVIRENRPLAGFGYARFWYDEEALDLLHTGFSKNSYLNQLTLGSHNGLIELWLNIGLIGLLAFFAMIISAFSSSEKLSADKYMICLAYMAFFTLLGFTERVWGTFDYKMLFLFVTVALGRQKNENLSNKYY